MISPIHSITYIINIQIELSSPSTGLIHPPLDWMSFLNHIHSFLLISLLCRVKRNKSQPYSLKSSSRTKPSPNSKPKRASWPTTWGSSSRPFKRRRPRKRKGLRVALRIRSLRSNCRNNYKMQRLCWRTIRTNSKIYRRRVASTNIQQMIFYKWRPRSRRRRSKCGNCIKI